MMNEEKDVKTGCWGKEGEVNKDRESEEKKKREKSDGTRGRWGILCPSV